MEAVSVDLLPELEGVLHRLIDLGGGVTIHVADAGPADGPPVMLVHGFPQNWWQWQGLIGPLAGDGYRVLCPDLRGAGWSSAPDDRYFKTDMAEDLAAVLDRWAGAACRPRLGGPVAFLMMLRHPEKVSGFFGLNTVAWMRMDLALVRHLWRFWFQFPISAPIVGPRVIGDPRGRYTRFVVRWAGRGFVPADLDLYVRRMGEAGHAVAGSRWLRAFHTREIWRWLRGEYAQTRVDVPVRWLHRMDDSAITPTLLRGYTENLSHRPVVSPPRS